MTLAVPFDQADAGLVSAVGGKGSNLIALTAAGFPVPPGFVVGADAYRQFLAGASWLAEELDRFDCERPENLYEQCRALRGRLGKVPLPADVEEAIRAALARLGAAPGDAFAVRSSSTFEDLAQAAFAGQHDTYLNVRGAEAIAGRVRDCFVSLWGDRAVLYRHRQGFRQQEACMAVVVQRQIACDRAGVAFSINPVSGRIDRLAIDANYGLGESVVSGECEVDHFELDKGSLAIVGRSVGRKDRMVAPTPVGVAEYAVRPDLADKPCLDDGEVLEIARLLRKVEEHYGWPQDIEWGWEGSKLWQFQSRPVTAFPPRWTRDESAERFPQVMTPLSWDFIRVAFRGSLAHSLALMGLPVLEGEWFAVFDNYVYGNQNAVDLIAAYRPLRARTAQELVAEIPDLRRRYSWVLDLPVTWARDLDCYLLKLGRLSAVDLAGADLPAVCGFMREVLGAAADYFRPNIAISMTQAFLHRLLHGLVSMLLGPERALAVVDGLLAGCETKTTLVNRELYELARLAGTVPALSELFLGRDGAALWASGGLEAFPEFAAGLHRFLADHGHREMDMDYYHPTWVDEPGIVLDAVALLLRDGPREDPAETARRQRQRCFETEHQFLSAVPAELRFFFRELIRLARTYTTLDDLEHYQTTRINPLARRAVLALGRCLHERGILDRPADAFFLHKADLDEMEAAYPHESREDFRRRASAAKASYEASKQQTPPWSLDEAGKQAAPPAAGALHGLPGSPGRVTGPCFLVRSPDDFARFPKGAVLVARTTNPAWTPLFYSASGLIAESGGPLSHGAVTAREMRLPAVMSVRGAMGLLQDGQVVTVDGTRGTVVGSQ
jgi:phosphohistidine swiveling domain-containing protein